MPAGRGNVITGARARFQINGTKCMYAVNVRYGEQIEHLPVEVLDQFDVAEHVPVAYRVSLSAGLIRLLKNPIKNRDGVAIMPSLENILSSEEMTATIEDRDGTVLANIERVRCAGYDSEVAAKALVMQNLQFVAIRVRDESEIT